MLKHNLAASVALALVAAMLSACSDKSAVDPAAAPLTLPASAPASNPPAPAMAPSAPDRPAEMKVGAMPDDQERIELLEQMSGVWKPVDEQLLLTIVADAGAGQVDILLAKEYLPATVESVDVRHGIVVLQVDLSGTPATWSFRRIVDAHGLFHFRSTLHNGVESELSFVRGLSTSDMERIGSAAEQERISSNAQQKALHDAAPDDQK